jgi:hypothetical protein
MHVYRLGAIAPDAHGQPYLCTIDSQASPPPGVGWTKLYNPTVSCTEQRSQSSQEARTRAPKHSGVVTHGADARALTPQISRSKISKHLRGGVIEKMSNPSGTGGGPQKLNPAKWGTW